MRWLLRPAFVILASLLLVTGAAIVVFQSPSLPVLARALPVGADEEEIAFLYGATNASNWERFVAALGQAAEILSGDGVPITAVIGPGAFPPRTASVPEVALHWSGGRLVFRWYKLTSDAKTADWIKSLVLDRGRPPLAIIGGNTSDAARELASELQSVGANLSESLRPLLLITTASADWVHDETDVPEQLVSPAEPPTAGENPSAIRLSRLYPGRTFRFCYTNRQMAVALTSFIWSREDLRPDADPVYLVRWEDDSYSRDLIDGFWQALHGLLARESALELAWAAGGIAHGGVAPFFGGVLPPARLGPHGSSFRMARLPTPQFIDSSVGTFDTPNRFEAQAARFLLLDLEQENAPRRPLLVVTGQSAPTRRFLRALARTSPHLPRRCVVTTGDALAFNTIYRDRCVTWPVQDLPFDLVFFCHHNPVDPDAGFNPGGEAGAPGNGDHVNPTTATGTEDLLLFRDMVTALGRAMRKDGLTPANAAALAQRLAELRIADGALGYSRGGRFFTANGNRTGGSGEHIVCLRPQFQDDRVLPEAVIEVWAWRTGDAGGRVWQRVGAAMRVSYGPAAPEGGGP